MGKKLLVEEMDGITTLRLTRQMTLEEFLGVLDDTLELGLTNRRLWDANRHFDFSAEEIRAIANHGKKIWPGAARVAFLAEDDLTFGLLRMFEAFREQENYQTKAFRDEEEAREWLLAWEE